MWLLMIFQHLKLGVPKFDPDFGDYPDTFFRTPCLFPIADAKHPVWPEHTSQGMWY